MFGGVPHLPDAKLLSLGSTDSKASGRELHTSEGRNRRLLLPESPAQGSSQSDWIAGDAKLDGAVSHLIKIGSVSRGMNVLMGGTARGSMPPTQEAEAWHRVVARCIPECKKRAEILEKASKEATAAALSSAPLAEPAWSMRMVPVAQFYEEPSGEIERIMQNRYGRDFEYATTPANHDAPELSTR